MLAWLRTVWVSIRDSLWFVPSLLTLVSVAAAVVLVQVESAWDFDLGGKDRHWLVGGSVDGARAVLSTIAGSLITVTGVVFSITIVTLQLASSQFTPRILRNFLADRTNQTVLGVFIGTFTYTLLVLRTIRSIDEGDEFVPELAVSGAIILMLISIGYLIYFIHHAARSVQATVILDRITTGALGQVDRLFPEEIGQPKQQAMQSDEVPTGLPQMVTAEREGYLQTVDGQSLFEQGEAGRMVVKMALPVGGFVVAGQPVAEVWSEKPLDQESIRSIREAFILGADRSPDQDLEYHLLEISDMAVKALSPSINDPTTASYCIDRLTQILAALGQRRPPAPLRTDEGKVHFIAVPTTFDGALDLAFSQVLHYGRSNPAIVGKLQWAIDLLGEVLPTERHKALQSFADKLEASHDSK